MFRLMIPSREGYQMVFDRWKPLIRWYTWSIESTVNDCMVEVKAHSFVKYRIATFDYQFVY